MHTVYCTYYLSTTCTHLILTECASAVLEVEQDFFSSVQELPTPYTVGREKQDGSKNQKKKTKKKNDDDNSMLYIDDGNLKSDAVFMWKLARGNLLYYYYYY